MSYDDHYQIFINFSRPLDSPRFALRAVNALPQLFALTVYYRDRLNKPGAN